MMIGVSRPKVNTDYLRMHKELMILGLVADFGPITGYDLHRIVRAHGELFTDLKKPNMYYLLERLGKEGYLRVRATSGARGRRGERIHYTLTPAGRRQFRQLLEEQIQRYDTVHTGIEVSVIFLSQLPRKDAVRFLEARQEAVQAHRDRVVTALGDVTKRGTLARISADHLVSLIDAEIAWVKRAIASVRSAPTRRVKAP
jgi:DNA-binding PadR family transcriptional regulator